jgi:ribosome-binding protein aMBF1 (putative translation factor)
VPEQLLPVVEMVHDLVVEAAQERGMSQAQLCGAFVDGESADPRWLPLPVFGQAMQEGLGVPLRHEMVQALLDVFIDEERGAIDVLGFLKCLKLWPDDEEEEEAEAAPARGGRDLGGSRREAARSPARASAGRGGASRSPARARPGSAASGGRGGGGGGGGGSGPQVPEELLQVVEMVHDMVVEAAQERGMTQAQLCGNFVDDESADPRWLPLAVFGQLMQEGLGVPLRHELVQALLDVFIDEERGAIDVLGFLKCLKLWPDDDEEDGGGEGGGAGEGGEGGGLDGNVLSHPVGRALAKAVKAAGAQAVSCANVSVRVQRCVSRAACCVLRVPC